jgi:hypothetical protein
MSIGAVIVTAIDITIIYLFVKNILKFKSSKILPTTTGGQ